MTSALTILLALLGGHPLSGSVAADSGLPLAGASVRVSGKSAAGAATDSLGRFGFDIPEGRYRVRVSYTGFESADTVVNAGPGAPELRLVLRQSVNQLDRVTVTSGRIPRPLKETPVVTRVISAPEIEAAAPRSLADILQNELPGIEFTRVEGSVGGATFFGMEAPYMLILVDGERMAGETSRSNPDFRRINPDNIERIEIVRGAMSTLYGSGAVAGVVNVITKKADKPFGATVTGLYDTEGDQKYSAGISAKGEKLSSVTSAVFRRKESYMLESRGYFTGGHAGAPPTPSEREIEESIEIEGFRNYLIEQKLEYKFTEKMAVSLRGGWYDHERFNAGIVGTKIHDVYRDGNGGIKAQYMTGEKSRLELSYDADIYSKYTDFLQTGETTRNYKNTLQNPKLIFACQGKKSAVVAGAESLWESLETYQFSQGVRRAQLTSAYAQYSRKITERLTVEAGLRGDGHSQYGFNATPRLSAMMRAGAFVFRGGYAAGYRSPTLKELYTDWDHQGLFRLQGNKNLVPETSRNLSLSAEMSKGRFSASANVFYNSIDDKITTVLNAGQDTMYYRNAESASVLGAELTAATRIGKHLVIRADFAHIRDNQRIGGRNVSAVRPNSATAHASYAFNVWDRPFSVALSGRWQDGIVQYALNSANGRYVKLNYDPYSIWKAAFTGKIGEYVSFNAGINNIFDYVPRHVTYNAPVTPGRTYYLSLTFKL